MCSYAPIRASVKEVDTQYLSVCVSLFRDDCSIFDGLMEEDEKDKAKR